MTNQTELLKNAEGPIQYGLTNDYMFRAVFQESGESLTYLLSALLNIPAEEILSCEVMNPIVLGETMDDKTCVLDIKVNLNNKKLINLEMQTGHFDNWTERAIYYLSKLFCSLKRGQEYSSIMSAIHIGILTESPFNNVHEFYSEYYMMNPKSMHVFSRKFSARVLDLSQLDNVPVEERNTELYYWSCLFKATTWEEIRMLTENRQYLADTAVQLRKLSEDEKVQMQCEMREKYIMDMNTARSEGREKGLAEGKAQGLTEGRSSAMELMKKLLSEGRIEDAARAAEDEAYCEQLMQEIQ